MKSEEYIKEIIDYLKEGSLAHASVSMKKYMDLLGYPQPINLKFSNFRKKFFENLETKTGWGKEQLKKLFDDTYFELSNENIS